MKMHIALPVKLHEQLACVERMYASDGVSNGDRAIAIFEADRSPSAVTKLVCI